MRLHSEGSVVNLCKNSLERFSNVPLQCKTNPCFMQACVDQVLASAIDSLNTMTSFGMEVSLHQRESDNRGESGM
jgi:hypothetical protein